MVGRDILEKEISHLNPDGSRKVELNKEFYGEGNDPNSEIDNVDYDILFAEKANKEEDIKEKKNLKNKFDEQKVFISKLKNKKVDSLDALIPYVVEHVDKYGSVSGNIDFVEGRFNYSGIPVERFYEFLGKKVSVEATFEKNDDNLQIMKENLESYFKNYSVKVDGNSVVVSKEYF